MFKKRSTKKELLDLDVGKEDLILNLKELHIINRYLGGYAISINALSQLNLNNPTILDLGSGGGDTLNAIHKWLKKKNITGNLIGIDLKSDCVSYANSHLNNNLRFIRDDYRNYADHVQNVDVLHASLFTHHLSNEEIIGLIKFARKNNTILIINDLERNPLAYYSIKILTHLFSKSHLVKNDAPLSVLRGFKKKEWQSLLQKAGSKQYILKWKWAFRHQIIIYG
ncbi:MAG: methyltransferase domain-containing protein [Bacteroidia bacterium]|nr:methyltransferase domain-containing protein [Bacteroidia bacterium]NNJ55482.1 methyltransferase domain-containing protein [Bacteroidia bacterium]